MTRHDEFEPLSDYNMECLRNAHTGCDLETVCWAAEKEINELRSRLLKANQIIRRWCNFDFDCPEEEYDEDSDCFGQEGAALDKLYDDTAAYLKQSSN